MKKWVAYGPLSEEEDVQVGGKSRAAMSKRVVVTRMFVGIFHMQVCAQNGVTDEEILAVCNSENPAGTSNGWTSVCHASTEMWPDVAPVVCADDSGRMHFLVAC